MRRLPAAKWRSFAEISELLAYEGHSAEIERLALLAVEERRKRNNIINRCFHRMKLQRLEDAREASATPSTASHAS